MIILNLINVIAIAMGIGTSVKNTNFEYEKKARRNEAENLQIDITLEYNSTPNQSIRISENPSQYAMKFKLDTNNFIYANIQDTVYEYTQNNYTSKYIVGIYKIKNYYNSKLYFNLTFSVAESGTYYYTKYGKIITGLDINDKYDMTLTANAKNQIDSIFTATSSYPQISYENSSSTESTQYINLGQFVLEQREEIQIMFAMSTYASNPTATPLKPNNINMQGEIIAIDNHTEVIDIPGLMFTILTLPFSFISQAFDLTIFPDTPYEINFTNLFMTILAIFILIWIIKHIFK